MTFTVISQLVSLVLLVTGSYATRDKHEVTYYIHNSECSNVHLNSSNLDLVDVSLPINLVVRGCKDNTWVSELTDAYLQNGDYNVIVADYTGSKGDYEPSSVKEVEELGSFVGAFISEIYDTCGGNLSDVHVIGFDLGAHVAAFAGQKVQELTELNVGRITGLDAAVHHFLLVGDEQRLSKDDADVVVAIHTNGGVYGFLETLGHVDFYPNGGILQAGCIASANECSHQRAHDYFIEAVTNPKGFVSKECQSYVLYELGLCDHEKSVSIGTELTAELAGTYYLKTNSQKPYSKE